MFYSQFIVLLITNARRIDQQTRFRRFVFYDVLILKTSSVASLTHSGYNSWSK